MTIPPYAFFADTFNVKQEKQPTEKEQSVEPAIDADSQEITDFEVQQIEVDPQAKAYYREHGIKNVHDAFTLANILHTNRRTREAATIYGLAFRIHPKRTDHYPLAQSLLQARLLCMLKSGEEPSLHEIAILRALNIPFANYIEGISMAWKGGDGRTALRHIRNAYEEFHTGEEIDSLYLEIVLKSAPELLQGKGHTEQNQQIPRKIFMYWDQNPPEEIARNFEFHKNIPGFEFKAFDKHEAAEWLYSNYGVEARGLFLNARHPAEAADFLRVHVTQIYGGWWLDADIRIRDEEALRFMASQTAENVFLLTYNGVVHNDFYGTIPDSSVGADCLLSLYRNCYLHHGLFIAYKTGPGVFNRALNRKAWRSLQGFKTTDAVQVYNHEVFDKVIDQFDTPYKAILPSWHSV
ncbi:hypothetical protein ATPR_0097 [Acetobacter tropicalis NBRC 101654]|uniref:Uncharacterized protein n=1 Tax=Acetobacter tropicalis NBRC 101654 TaxID=749388 RepID=F7V9P8_9PROT|nr:hypothetical protein [Acetobacter tropicalis]GAA07093.1 hypothetical protein ATPR_0097 [Acetobacter tropicalis NBRC 101654]